MTKITKRNFYAAMINFATTGEMAFETENGTVVVSADELTAFAQNEIALLDKKAVKAKETAAKKKDEADELMVAVQAVLTDEYQTIADVAAQIEGATVAKATYRLNRLVEMGVAEKTDVKIEKRTVKAFRLAQ